MGSSDLLIFKMRGVPQVKPKKAGQTEAEEPKKEVRKNVAEAAKPKAEKAKTETPEQAAKHRGDESSIYYREGGEYPDPLRFYEEAIAHSETVARPKNEEVHVRTRGGEDSRAKASGLFCAAHPFRHAYAICAYCHRPFCFEDTVEYQKNYYCIEDIDRITTQYTETLSDEYSASSLLTSFIIMGTFLLFLYYSNGQLIYVFSYMVQNPIQFVHSINLSYALIVASALVMVLTLLGAFYILIGSKRGHMISTVVSIITVMLFIYQYVTSGTVYLAVIAGFEFAAFLAAVNSAASEALAYSQTYEKGPDYGLAYGYGARY